MVRMAYHTLSKRYFLPYENLLHASEILQAARGERSLPPADEEIIAEAKSILGYMPVEAYPYEALQKHETAELIYHRINLALVISGRPPLPQFRDRCYPTLLYAIVVALCFDPNNLTLWSERVVYAENLPGDSYLVSVWKLKLDAYAHLEKLGFVMTGRMHRNALAILHLVMDINRFRCWNARNDSVAYLPAIEKAEAHIKERINGMAAEGYLRYLSHPGEELSKAEYKRQFDHAAHLAFRLDPLDTELDQNWLASPGLEGLLPKYKHFLTQETWLFDKYEHFSEIMMPMHKVSKMQSSQKKPFVKWWTPIPQAERDQLPELDRNVSLSVSQAGTLGSLAEKVAQMAIEPAKAKPVKLTKKQLRYQEMERMKQSNLALEKFKAFAKKKADSPSKGFSNQKTTGSVMDDEIPRYDDSDMSFSEFVDRVNGYSDEAMEGLF